VGTSGGGIYNLGSLKFINCTVSNNESYFSGGIDGGATLKNTIVAYNTAATPDSGNCVGTFTSQDYNLSSDSTCNLTTPNDMEDTDPLLSPLRDNGGPTWTHALLPGSPAINYIPIDQCFVDKDQRGVNRPQGPKCDIGAYEVENEDPEINEIYLPITMR
jgi:hypothetical protein